MLGRVSGSRLKKIPKDTFCPRRSQSLHGRSGRGHPICSLSPPCDEEGESPAIRISRELSPSGSLTPFFLLFFFFIFSLSTDTELLVLTDSELLVLSGRVISWRPTELVTVVPVFFFFWHLRKQLTNSSFFKDRAQILSVRRGKTLKVTCGDPPPTPKLCPRIFLEDRY